MSSMSRASHSRVQHLVALCALLLLAGVVATRTHHAHARGKPAAETMSAGPTPNPPIGVTISVSAVPQPRHDRGENVELRVLMIGNSYTMHHSLHLMLQRVAAGVEGGPRLIVDSIARGGYSLRNHLKRAETLQRIRNGHYTHVVLQGHSMSALDHPAELEMDAERLKQAIDAASGRTVFYATWARSPEVLLYRRHKLVHSFEEMTNLVSSTYFELSTKLGAGLAPVGRAFERALVQSPKLTLWGSDGSHPSLAGSYMAACVLYGAITGGDPSQTTYVPEGMTEADATLVRAVASQSLAAANTQRALIGNKTKTTLSHNGPT
jgi:hypothetical protein